MSGNPIQYKDPTGHRKFDFGGSPFGKLKAIFERAGITKQTEKRINRETIRLAGKLGGVLDGYTGFNVSKLMLETIDSELGGKNPAAERREHRKIFQKSYKKGKKVGDFAGNMQITKGLMHTIEKGIGKEGIKKLKSSKDAMKEFLTGVYKGITPTGPTLKMNSKNEAAGYAAAQYIKKVLENKDSRKERTQNNRCILNGAL